MAILAGVLLARAEPAAEDLTTSGIAEFSAAYQAWDGTRFAKAAELFRQAEAKTPETATNYYWHGAALFHQMLQTGKTPDRGGGEDLMIAALAALETAVKLDAGNAEAHALLGTLYGMKINDGILRALRYGPTVQAHQELALKHGAENPRVRYLLGTGQFHTAKDAAGRREALNTLLVAVKLFEAEAKQPAKPFEPRWGYSSCLTFVGRSCELLGLKTEAAAYYQKALDAHPADVIAKEGLVRLTGK